MLPRPGDRIMGLETEFGCLVLDETLGSPEAAVNAIKDHIFYDQRLGAIDLHSRDEVFEPAQSGGFLINGARLYIDAVGSHLEYATAECRSLKDLVANDRAGQAIITRAIRDLGLSEQVKVFNNSVDHFGGHTFGCHENFLCLIEEGFFAHTVTLIYAFLVTRQIFAGVGRVGGHVLSATDHRPTYQEVIANPVDFIWVSQVYGVYPDDSVQFQLSQRADHILKTVASRVRFNRALINPKWEHFYSHDLLQRLHLLFGESNQNEFAYALKVGTTSLVLRLAEDGVLGEDFMLAHALLALRDVSRDTTYSWPVVMADGSTSNAIEIQRRYLELAEAYRGESEQVNWILDNWAMILDGLERDPMSLDRYLDWVAKKKILESYIAEEGTDWSDEALHSIDLEYHNINPDQSLFHAWQSMVGTERMVTDTDILDAMTDPPSNTRAAARGSLVRKVLAQKGRKHYAFDWNGAMIDTQTYIDLSDPYESKLP